MKYFYIILLCSLGTITLAQNKCQEVYKCQEDCYKEIKNKPVEFNGGESGLYNGCVDKFEQFSGCGELKSNNIFLYKGCFKNGRQEGHGKEIQYNSSGTINHVYEGPFKDGKRHGNDGELRFFATNYIWKGEFKDGQTTDNGHWNYENYYNPSDISFAYNSNSATLKLDKHPKKLTNHIEIKFNDITELFLFDTGASEMMISEKLFYKLKKQNIKFTDVEVEIPVRDAENEVINTKMYTVDISIGDVNIKNLKILVGKNLDNLFGLNALKKFSNYEMCINGKKGGECIVYK